MDNSGIKKPNIPLRNIVKDHILYEQPLNERIRTFLRLEYLFSCVDNSILGNSAQDNRTTIDLLLSIVSIFERSDLKLEILKELERLSSTLAALKNTPQVDNTALAELLAEFSFILEQLHTNKSAIGHALRENDFLYSIRQRSSIAGGSCDFDLPSYHFWLQHINIDQRHQQLKAWLDHFSHVRSAISLILRLIRTSTNFNLVIADTGFYQQSLDNQQVNQLIRIQIPQNVDYYPEISGGKHRFNVRFMQFDLDQRSQQVNHEISFLLSCCAM